MLENKETTSSKSLPLSYLFQIGFALTFILSLLLSELSDNFDLPDELFNLITLLSIPAFFISSIISLFSTRKSKIWHKIITRSLLLLSALILSVCLYFLFGDTISDFWHREKFDAKLWRASADINGEWPPRLCMVDNLMKKKILDGLTKEKVIELLGEPASKGFPFGAIDCDIHYYLGPERGFMRIDSEWLFITLDKDGKVNRYWIYRD
jgi:hypothetical protein